MPDPPAPPPALPASADYRAFLEDLKSRVRAAQIRASVAVNGELVLLYWRIGRDVLSRQEQLGWGARVIDQLSADLRRAFPEMKGFSVRNLKYMRALAEAWPDEEFVQQAVAHIPRVAGSARRALVAGWPRARAPTRLDLAL